MLSPPLLCRRPCAPPSPAALSPSISISAVTEVDEERARFERAVSCFLRFVLHIWHLNWVCLLMNVQRWHDHCSGAEVEPVATSSSSEVAAGRFELRDLRFGRLWSAGRSLANNGGENYDLYIRVLE